MPINIPNPGLFEQQLGQHCVDFRKALDNLLHDAAYLSSVGGASFLTGAPFNKGADDAALIMNTVGAVTADNPVVQTLQAFIASTEALWGGQ
jgi:hypothetical protein